MQTLRKDDRGAALVYVLLTVTLAAVLTTGLMMLILNRVRMLSVDEARSKEYYIADGVVEILKSQGKDTGVNDLIRDFSGADAEEFEGEAPIPETNDPIVYYYVPVSRTSVTVVYYGEQYKTEIQYNSLGTPSYTVKQTPREAAAEEGESA
jgi:hypothetical protein